MAVDAALLIHQMQFAAVVYGSMDIDDALDSPAAHIVRAANARLMSPQLELSGDMSQGELLQLPTTSS